MLHWKTFRAKKLNDIIAVADEYVFHGELEKIIEVTYSYREIEGTDFILNETLFEEYLGLTYPETSINLLSKKYKFKIKKQIRVIDKIIGKIGKIKFKEPNESIRGAMLSEALEYVKNILHISLLGLEFEAEKAGLSNKLTPSDIEKIIKEIEIRERSAFEEKLIENQDEFSYCYNFVKRNHNTKKNCLHVSDCKKMSGLLKKIKKQSNFEIIDTPKQKRKILRGKFLKKEISRKDYRKVFDSVCEFYNLPQRTKLTNAGSIYDGDNFLEIPRDNSHAYFSLDKLLRLLTHEIESHYINTYNGQILLGSFRGAKNLPKEEGLAMFMEKIFTGYTYDNIDNILEYYFIIMAGESLEGEDFNDFVKIMEGEYKMNRASKKSIIRAKRNYSLNHIGVQHKDTVYFRGLTKIIKYLKSGGQFRKLFLGKVGFHDLDNLYKLYNNHERKEEIIFPIFISDLIYYYFTNAKKDKKFEFDAQEYYLYLKKKYWFIDLDCFNIIEQINTKHKKIKSIIKIIEKSI